MLRSTARPSALGLKLTSFSASLELLPLATATGDLERLKLGLRLSFFKGDPGAGEGDRDLETDRTERDRDLDTGVADLGDRERDRGERLRGDLLRGERLRLGERLRVALLRDPEPLSSFTRM